VPLNPYPPRPVDAHSDADARAGRDRSDRNSTILDVQPVAREIEAIVREGDVHRHREIAGTATQIVRSEGRTVRLTPPFHRAAAPALHHVDAVERLERADQHGRRRTVRFGDDVDEAVDAVIETDLGVARRPVERLVAACRTRCGVAGRIGLTDVGLDLDDDPARRDAAAIVDEDFAQEITRDDQRRAIVESSRELGSRSEAMSV